VTFTDCLPHQQRKELGLGSSLGGERLSLDCLSPHSDDV